MSARDRKHLTSQDLLLQKALEGVHIHAHKRVKKNKTKHFFFSRRM